MIALPVLLIGCTRGNPAFDECEELDCRADESGDATDTPGDGDGDGGDGDGDTGPGDGDGDGDTGDGDGDTGDGDGDGDTGDPGLPTCPESIELTIPIAQDTFLDGTPADSDTCVIDWNYDQNAPALGDSGACSWLDFGAVPMHWVCGSDMCNSTWLGQFAVWGLEDQAPVVQSADIVFTAKIINGESNQVSLYTLDAAPQVFGNCGQWLVGQGYGELPIDCVTTFMNSASPMFWPDPGPTVLDPNSAIASVYAPMSLEGSYHAIVMPVSKTLVQDWLTGAAPHTGLLLQSHGWLPTEFNLLAQGSESPPELIIEVCTNNP